MVNRQTLVNIKILLYDESIERTLVKSGFTSSRLNQCVHIYNSTLHCLVLYRRTLWDHKVQLQFLSVHAVIHGTKLVRCTTSKLMTLLSRRQSCSHKTNISWLFSAPRFCRYGICWNVRYPPAVRSVSLDTYFWHWLNWWTSRVSINVGLLKVYQWVSEGQNVQTSVGI